MESTRDTSKMIKRKPNENSCYGCHGYDILIGAFFLPIHLTKLDFEFLKVGRKGEAVDDGIDKGHFKK